MVKNLLFFLSHLVLINLYFGCIDSIVSERKFNILSLSNVFYSSIPVLILIISFLVSLILNIGLKDTWAIVFRRTLKTQILLTPIFFILWTGQRYSLYQDNKQSERTVNECADSNENMRMLPGNNGNSSKIDTTAMAINASIDRLNLIVKANATEDIDTIFCINSIDAKPESKSGIKLITVMIEYEIKRKQIFYNAKFIWDYNRGSTLVVNDRLN